VKNEVTPQTERTFQAKSPLGNAGLPATKAKNATRW
jgi:hypothetical protein